MHVTILAYYTRIKNTSYYLLLDNTRAIAVRITIAAFSISFFVCPDDTAIRRSGVGGNASCAAILCDLTISTP